MLDGVDTVGSELVDSGSDTVDVFDSVLYVGGVHVGYDGGGV